MTKLNRVNAREMHKRALRADIQGEAARDKQEDDKLDEMECKTDGLLHAYLIICALRNRAKRGHRLRVRVPKYWIHPDRTQAVNPISSTTGKELDRYCDGLKCQWTITPAPKRKLDRKREYCFVRVVGDLLHVSPGRQLKEDRRLARKLAGLQGAGRAIYAVHILWDHIHAASRFGETETDPAVFASCTIAAINFEDKRRLKPAKKSENPAVRAAWYLWDYFSRRQYKLSVKKVAIPPSCRQPSAQFSISFGHDK